MSLGVSVQGAATIVVGVIAALAALWAIGAAVYLVGAKMKGIIDRDEHVEDRAAVWGWGVLYTLAGLFVLFLLVRFVKFAWTLE